MPARSMSSATVPGSSMVAMRSPNSAFTTASIRAAVVKSGAFRQGAAFVTVVKSKGTSRSTRPPEEWCRPSARPGRRGRRRLRADAAGDDGALRHGLSPSVSAIQRGHHKSAAEQALGIADGADGDVDRPPGAGEGRQGGRDEYRGDVLGAILLARSR